MPKPSDELERQYRREGRKLIAGIDEVGMGCLAGPVVASAVIFGTEYPSGIDDSKRLSPKLRESLAEGIQKTAVGVGVGLATVEEIDRLNIFHAARLAMVRAIALLGMTPDLLLVDGRHKPLGSWPQESIISGDQKSLSIAAASIVAKVFRDRLMVQLAKDFPQYAFERHKGYGSVVHRLALQRWGPTPWHRKSFSWTPVEENREAQGGT